MTQDVIALTERMPDAWSLVAGLMSGGPETRLDTAGDGAVLQLCDADGRPLASVEAPMLVKVPGEVRRLLGTDVDGPVWWTEVRAATAARNAGRLAGTVAGRLAAQLGGVVWPADAAPGGGVSEPVAEVDSVTAPAAAQPAVDVLSESSAVVIQDRPVVAMTAWLSDALRAAAASGRGLQIVTPRTSRLTLPTRAALSGLPNRWVVNDGEGGYYDGLSGAELRWQDGTFASTGSPAAAFTEHARSTGSLTAGGERQLAVTIRTRQPADRDLLLGGALETLWWRLAGSTPGGWGTGEPACLTWSRHELTEYTRERAPQATWLVVVGRPDRPALATVRVSRTTGGVEEDITFAMGLRPGEDDPADEELRALAARLVAEHGLVTMLVQRREARADLTFHPQVEMPPTPVAFTLGSGDVRGIGVTRARRPPLPDRPVQLGPLHEAGFHYPLREAGWDGFRKLVEHLRTEDETGTTSPTR
ncbi:DUF6177 family protein [Streptomyces sp. 549]|uniref:DUF6177 family protein n=1 Tax=Streptomyces sp. 549 TaxID=3049076 RepID=UPI0024C3628B|nr:DUF6177 family protein [Streptomyces sp. 549]MDK1472958.1 DUF6177 family protein [Streptomyces sp. 549]